MENTELWQQIIKTLEPSVSAPSFKTWIEPTKLLSYVDNTLTIEVPNQFAMKFFMPGEKFYLPLLAVAREILGNDTELLFQQATSIGDNSVNSQNSTVATENIVKQQKNFLNPKYTFDRFVEGKNNDFARNAALAVAEAPGTAYNPFFIYGGVGLGKTHLMQAIGHFVLEAHPGYKVTYVSSEKFTNDLINSIRFNSGESFRETYRDTDLLLVDDIQFFAGKESTQEEFFHTFNALHNLGKQLVISSDRHPREIPTLTDRLRSRFEMGLITDIKAPDLETRIAILRKKAADEGWHLPNDVIVNIANQVSSNIRELEGALIKIIAYCSFQNCKITLDIANEVLKDFASKKANNISIPVIQQMVAEFYEIDVSDLISQKRTKNIALPRQIAMYLTRELTEYSLPKIGKSFGGRDHTTVIHSYDKIQELMEKDEEINRTVKNFIHELGR